MFRSAADKSFGGGTAAADNALAEYFAALDRLELEFRPEEWASQKSALAGPFESIP